MSTIDPADHFDALSTVKRLLKRLGPDQLREVVREAEGLRRDIKGSRRCAQITCGSDAYNDDEGYCFKHILERLGQL